MCCTFAPRIGAPSHLPRNSCDAYFYSQKEIVAGCIVTSVAHCRTKDDALAYVLAVVTAAMGDLTKNEVARVGEEFVRVVCLLCW